MIFLFKPLCCVLDYDHCDLCIKMDLFGDGLFKQKGNHQHLFYYAEFSKIFCNVLSESIETFFRL